MITGKMIKEARTQKKITQKELARLVGVNEVTIRSYEADKYSPKIEVAAKLADVLNLDLMHVFSTNEMITCPKCGLSYIGNLEEENLQHSIEHKKWENAVDTFGFCYAYAPENERIKSINRNIVNDNSLSLEKRYNAQIEVFKCLFSRSLSASDYSNKHTDFKTYISMLLFQQSTKERLDSDLYNKLVNEFGAVSGIPSGETYYYPPKANHTSYSFDTGEFTKEDLEKIKAFAEFIKTQK